MDEHLAVCPEGEQDCPFKHYGCAVKVWMPFCFCLYIPLCNLYSRFILLFDPIQDAEGHSLWKNFKTGNAISQGSPENRINRRYISTCRYIDRNLF